MSYPVRHGEMINCVGMVREAADGTPYDGPLVSVVDREEYSNVYADWEDEALALIEVSLPIFIYCLSPVDGGPLPLVWRKTSQVGSSYRQ